MLSSVPARNRDADGRPIMRQPATTGGPRGRPQRRARSVARWLALLLLAGAGLAALWIFRAPVAEWTVAWLAARNGLGPATVTVDEIGFDRVVARQLRLGRAGTVGLDRLDAAYSLAGLIAGRIDAITIRGLRIDARIEPDRLVVTAADPPLEVPLAGGGPPRLPRLPAAKIRLEDARLGLETDRGRIALTMGGSVEQDRDGPITFNVEAALQHNGERANLAWQGTARGNPDGSIAVRVVSRHRASVGSVSGEGAAVVEIERSANALSVAFDVTGTSVGGNDVRATDIVGRGTVQVRDQAVRAVKATLRVGALRAGGLDATVPRFAVSYDGAKIAAEGRLTGAAGDVALSAHGNARDAARPVALALKGVVHAAAMATLLPAPARATGRVTFDVTGEIRSPVEAAAAPPDWRRLASFVTLTGTAGADLRDLAFADKASAETVSASVDLRLADGSLRVESAAGLTATGVRLAPAMLERLPDAVREQLAGPPALISIGNAGASRFAAVLGPITNGSSIRVVGGLRARSGPRRAAAELDARIRLGDDLALHDASLAYLSVALKGLRYRGMTTDIDALLNDVNGTAENGAGYLAVTASARGALPGTKSTAQATLDLNGGLVLADRRISVTPAEDSKVAVRRFDMPGALRLAAPLTLRFGGSGSHIAAPLDGGDLGVRLRIAPVEGSFDVAGHGRTGMRIASAVATADGGAYRLVLSGGSLTGEAAPFAADGIAGRVVWGPGGKGAARLSVARVRHTGAPALIAPLTLDIEADVKRGRAEFSVRSPPGAPGAAFSVKGRYDLAKGRGTAEVGVGPVRFAPGGVQPGALSPRLAGIIKDAEGALGVAGTVELGSAGLRPSLTVSLDGLGFATEAVRVRDIEGKVMVDGLAPTTTAPDQQVSALIVLGALPPMPVTARFRLRPDGRLEIENASLDFAGGKVTTKNVVADLGALAADAAVDVADLSVERLLALLKIPELSGTGKLAGRIDVRLRGGRVTSAKGTLGGAGAGILRISDPAVLRNLAKREDTVGLAMKALANFRYESLAIDVDVGERAAGKVLVRLKGANPEVLEGYPFAFNVNLETEFGRLAELVMSGARSAEAFVGTTLGDVVR